MNILVTGGAGYIGSHACKAIAKAGHLPIVLDDLSFGHEWAVKWGPLHVGDLADGAFVHGVFAKHKIDAVMHFAGSTYVGESVSNPGKYFRNNSVNALNLLNAMLLAGVKTIVFSSTCATYGIPMPGPISENHPQDPASPYGESKLFVEKMLKWYGQAHGIKWAALRYFNAAGADPDGEIGEDHDPETHLIPLAIRAAMGTGPELSVFGTDYHTPDGTAIRDYVHVSDLAAAHLSAMDRLQVAGWNHLCLNLGTGKGQSVLDVMASVERVSGRKVPRRTCPRREGDPPMLVADNVRAWEMLGWSPQYAEIDEMVGHAWKWEQLIRKRLPSLSLPEALWRSVMKQHEDAHP
jgi:UDP-arabinose 4-epimerase